jgi:hypothetical protein
MKIIVYEDKTVRLSGNENPCTILDMRFYISKAIENQAPLKLYLDRYAFTLIKDEKQHENYNIYKVFDFMNVDIFEGNKIANLKVNDEKLCEFSCYHSALKRNNAETIVLNGEGK